MDKISDVYKNLFHYTQRSGLEGILKSQSLWATHINFLNDQSEYRYAGETIHLLLCPRVCALIEEKISKSEAARKFVEANGGVEAYSSNFAHGLVRATYKVTGDDFYVLSLCGDHSSSRVVKNGLLSQWRAYGSGCGFAIVFNAKELEELAGNEFDKFEYVTAHMSDAIYGEDDEKFKSEFLVIFDDFLKLADKLLREAVFNESGPSQEEKSAAFKAVHWCLTRFKHPGFSEENEVRIVGAPAMANLFDIGLDEVRKTKLKPQKETKFRLVNGKKIPYISLFGFPDKKLPIEKIIVGPGENKNTIAKDITKLVSNTNIDVTVSDIPFV